VPLLPRVPQSRSVVGSRLPPRLWSPRTSQSSPKDHASASKSHPTAREGSRRAQRGAHLPLELLRFADVVLVAGLHACLHRRNLPLTGEQLLLQLALHGHRLGPLGHQLLQGEKSPRQSSAYEFPRFKGMRNRRPPSSEDLKSSALSELPPCPAAPFSTYISSCILFWALWPLDATVVPHWAS